MEALHRYLALTPARLLNVALTDAVGDHRTQNQPGTTDEYPNWRVPLSGPDGTPLPLEEVLSSTARDGARESAAAGRAAGTAALAAPTIAACPSRAAPSSAPTTRASTPTGC